MTALWAGALAAAATAALLGLPRAAAVRVRVVLPSGPRVRAGPSGAGVAVSRPGPDVRDRRRRRPPLAGLAAVPRAVGVVVLLVVVLLVVVLLVVVLLVVVLLVVPGAAASSLLVPLVLVAAASVAGTRLRRARRLAAARREERGRAVEACAALAGELRAGRPPADALTAAAELGAGPFAAALRAAAGAVRLGGDAASALRPPADSAVPEVLRSLAACWTVCAGSGSGLAAAVERLEEGLRAEQAQRRAVEAELAGPRATAGLLAVLPAGGLLLAAGLGADPLSVLLTTPVGLVCLAVGLGLDVLGLWWTGRLVAAAGGRP